MDTSPSSSGRHYRKKKEKFLQEVISPAIRGKPCPICLKPLMNHRKAAIIINCLHAYCLDCIRKWSNLKRRCPLCNAPFHSWFCHFSFSSRQFFTEKLPPLNVITEKTQSSSIREISRENFETIREGRRSRALPWRRRFGRPGSFPENVVAERKLRWRASVYKRGLQSVPLSARNGVKQNVQGLVRDGYARERIRERIEPWIRRELQAILDDPDPSIIVHVASSLYISHLVQGRCDVHSSQLGVEDSFFAPLLPFLRSWTKMFWHELRCFAESSLTMEAYDEVVTYERLRQVS